MRIEIINNQDKVRLDLRSIEKAASYILSKFDRDSNKSVNIIFLNDEEIKRLNRDYREIDSATDVLSFSYLEDSIDEGGSSPAIIGEIYISPPSARKNALRQGKDWNTGLEILLLIMHGMLHIYGYDHEQEDDEAEMACIQASLMHDIRSKNWKWY